MKVSSYQIKVIIITSIVILLPILFGLLKWSALPDQMPIHFQLSGQADGWSSKGFAVLGFPLILLAVQAVMFVALGFAAAKSNISNLIYTIVMSFIPLASIIGSIFIYTNSLK